MGKVSYNIIDSVKGGSGKTSLSLMLAMAAQYSLDKGAKEAKRNPAIQTLVLDMDMQGSALAEMLFGKADMGKNGKAEQYLDQRILSYYRKSSKTFISYPSFDLFKADEESQLPENKVQIGVALASPELVDRLAFRASSRQNYSSQITYTAFTAGLREVLYGLDAACPSPPRYVFFDMPPNSNGYSDAVPELLLQEDKNLRPDKGNYCNYFALTTLDRGHINATLNWFEYFVNDKYNSFPDRFFFMFNNIPPAIDKLEAGKGLWDEVVKMMTNRVQPIIRSAKQDYSDRIYFAGVGYQIDYLRTCCSADALGVAGQATAKGARLTSDMLTPIKVLRPLCSGADVGSSETGTGKLLHLITPGSGTEGAT